MCTGPHPFIPAADTAEVKMIFESLGQECLNVFHVRTTDGWTTELLQGVAEFFRDWWDDNLKSQAGDECELVAIQATDIAVEAGAQYYLTAGMPIAGVNSNPAAPGNVTVAVKLATGFTGRSRRGRKFIVGLTEGSTEGNMLESGTRTAIQDAYDTLLAEIDPAVPDGQLVIVSFCDNGDWRDDALVTRVLTASVNPELDSQRRRLSGRGA